MPGVPPVTPRLGLTRYAPGDAATFVAYLNDLVDDLDAVVPPIIHPANFAALPAAGIIDRLAWVDDVNVIYRDTGSAWEPASVADLAITTAKLANGAVTAAKLGAVGLVPIGCYVTSAFAGDVDEGNGKYLLADGRLVDKTVYAALFAKVGHAYNGGVDPGGNMVKIPDKRGRVSVGADNMGTAQGAAGRLPVSNRALGQNGGEERHLLTGAESGTSVHAHGDTFALSSNNIGQTAGWQIPIADVAWQAAAVTLGGTPKVPLSGLNLSNTQGIHTHNVNGGVSNAAVANAAAAHNTMQPYEVDHVLIRVQ